MSCKKDYCSCDDEIPPEADFIDKDPQGTAEESCCEIGDCDNFSSSSSGKAEPPLKE